MSFYGLTFPFQQSDIVNDKQTNVNLITNARNRRRGDHTHEARLQMYSGGASEHVRFLPTTKFDWMTKTQGTPVLSKQCIHFKCKISDV